MIYTVICKYKKRDCLIWQSLSGIPEDIASLVKVGKSEKTRKERTLAYSALFFALKELFFVDSYSLLHTKDGKPYIECEKNNPPKINISHSNSIAAVTLSDEGEVGVDIEVCEDGGRIKRLCERFFPDARLENSGLNIRYLIFTLDDGGAYSLTALDEGILRKPDSSSSLWTHCEAIIKCDGRGFGAAGEIGKLSTSHAVETRMLEIDGEIFSISTAKEK